MSAQLDIDEPIGQGIMDDGNLYGRNDPPAAPTASIVQKTVSACAGALLTSLLVTPLDVVKTRLQSQSQHPSNAAKNGHAECSPRPSPFASSARSITRITTSRLIIPSDLGVTACCREVFFFPTPHSPSLSALHCPMFAGDLCAVERRFEGTWEGLVKIARYEGIRSLWRGLSPTLVMAIPANVIYFVGYDTLRTKVFPTDAKAAYYAPLLCGGMARALAATAISPLELFRTRLQATSSTASGTTSHFTQVLTGIKTMVASHGLRSLWRGLSLTLWRDVPFSGVYWLGYEQAKEMISKGGGWGLGTFGESFVAGAASGTIAAFLTTPFDVAKTRRQVEVQGATTGAAVNGAANGSNGNGGANGKTNAGGKPHSVSRLMADIVKEEGIRGLWRGCVPRLLKVSPACAIMISSYEMGKLL
ncbi:Carrier protein, mitochondrial [Saitoella coloradoensis]